MTRPARRRRARGTASFDRTLPRRRPCKAVVCERGPGKRHVAYASDEREARALAAAYVDAREIFPDAKPPALRRAARRLADERRLGQRAFDFGADE